MAYRNDSVNRKRHRIKSNERRALDILLYGDPDTPAESFEEHLCRLPQRHATFVRNVVSGKPGNESYTLAGFTGNSRSAQVGASQLLKRPAVAAAIKQGRVEAAKNAKYELEDMVRELNDVAQFAQDTGNATAYARAVELKGKALGLLIDRQDIRMNQTVDMTGLLIEANQRVKLLPPADAEDATLVPPLVLPQVEKTPA